ncbi:MAG: RNA polymerase sigma factor [Sedimentisphaerales bacterium]
MVEDRLLIWRFKAGDKAALARIYEKYKIDLLRIAAGLLNEMSVAEDVVHDVFVTFAQSSDKLRQGGNLKGYLVTCVANRARNCNRTQQRRVAVSLDETEPAVSGSDKPEQWIIRSEELDALNSAMAQLPYPQREVVVLHFGCDGEITKSSIGCSSAESMENHYEKQSKQTRCGDYCYRCRIILFGV